MRRFLRLWPALLLQAALLRAETLESSYPAARAVFTSERAVIVPVKSREIVNLVDRLDRTAGHGNTLPPELAREFLKRIHTLARAKSSAPSRQDMERFVGNLAAFDYEYVQPISRAQWEAMLNAAAKTAEESFDKVQGNWGKLVDLMLSSAIAELKDPHSSYMTPEDVAEMRRDNAQSFSGIGVSMGTKDGYPFVEFPFSGSPALAAGIQDEDLITAVEGVSIHGWPLSTVIPRILGKPGTPVRLTIRREGQEKVVTVTRAEVKSRNLLARMINEAIGYVRFGQFLQNTHEEFKNAVLKLRADHGVKGVIIDLRGNPGGQVPTVTDITSNFLLDGQDIVTMKRRGTWSSRHVVSGDGIFKDIRVVVLIDEGSASASEIVAGALGDHKVGFVVGSRSFGKGSQQVLLPDNGGGMARITTDKWYTPSGRSIDSPRDPETGKRIGDVGGVKPDFEISLPLEQETAILKELRRQVFGVPLKGPMTADPAMDKAIELLSKPMS
ncbi:MAG: S41 family peptidase [Elusimicrobia bacterium]|nr:S41 family peptidase [Elusimicrobiota bacterium]